jgi:hypothetical protein
MTDWLLIILNPHRMPGIPQTEAHMFQIFVVVACDYLWFTRNKSHHDGLIPNALVISATINKTVLEHHSAWTTKLVKTPDVWKRPSPSYFKINYDTVIRDSFSTQAAVCNNSTGSIIKCSSLISSPYIAIYGETLATLLAANLAISLKLPSFILEGDSLNVILTLQQSAITQDWRLASTISHIHSIIPPTASWKASRVNRRENFCAHHVANWTTTRLHSNCIPILSPLSSFFLHVMKKTPPPPLFPSFDSYTRLQLVGR